MRIYLVRHGKAEKRSQSGRDEDRPLLPRGERQSRWIGETLAAGPRELRPLLILSSPALRAQETAKLIHAALDCDLKLEPRLFLGEPVEDALAVLASDTIRNAGGPVMLVGHNPTMEIMLPVLIDGLPLDESEMKTGMAAVIELPGTGPVEGQGRLIAKLRLAE